MAPSQVFLTELSPAACHARLEPRCVETWRPRHRFTRRVAAEGVVSANGFVLRWGKAAPQPFGAWLDGVFVPLSPVQPARDQRDHGGTQILIRRHPRVRVQDARAALLASLGLAVPAALSGGTVGLGASLAALAGISLVSRWCGRREEEALLGLVQEELEARLISAD